MVCYLLAAVMSDRILRTFLYFSQPGGVHDRLREYVLKNFPEKVVLLKTPQREGIMRARMFGAKEASGEVSTLSLCVLKCIELFYSSPKLPIFMKHFFAGACFLR